MVSYKVKFFFFFMMLILVLLSNVIILSSELELPKRPVREFASMTMALNPDKSEVVRLKIPWGYLAPNLSYLTVEDQNSFFLKAKAMMLLMGLTSRSVEKKNNGDLMTHKYTEAFSFNALYPKFEAKSLGNIENFVSKNKGIRQVIDITVFSSSKSKYWNHYEKGILSSYNIVKTSTERQLLSSKRFKNYGASLTKLPSQYGLSRLGLSNADVKKMRSDGVLESTIPNDIWTNRNESGDLISYMECMSPDVGLVCRHVMHVANINSIIKLSYHPDLLKDWYVIERSVRQLFKKFIDLGKG